MNLFKANKMRLAFQKRRKHSILTRTILLFVVVTLLLGSTDSALATTQINGAGATFPFPFIQKTEQGFNSTYPGYQVNYQAVGSGAGINNLINKAVDFAGSDAPLTDTQRASAPNSLHIPETIGSIAMAYNLPSIGMGVNLTGPIVADIYRGVITNWSNATIQSINPSITLPNHSISVVYRSDGSGTTFVFTSYLSIVSPAWAAGPGNGTTVAWPVGVGEPKNAGVASYVNTTTYTIGYVELNYALGNRMTFARLKNPMDQYVLPSLSTTQNAVNAYSTSLPAGDQSWYQVRMLNLNVNNAYPIASFSYFLVYKELNVIPGITAAQANLVVSYLWYHIHGGQALAAALFYVPLPAPVVTIDETTLNSITFNGVQVSNIPGDVPPPPPGTDFLPIIAGVIVILLIVGGGGVFYVRRRRSESTMTTASKS